MASEKRTKADFFKPYARTRRPFPTEEDGSSLPPPSSRARPHVLLPPSPTRPRPNKALFTAFSKLQRDSSPSFSSSPLSDRPPDLLSDDFKSPDAEDGNASSGSDTNPPTAAVNGEKLGQEGAYNFVSVVRNSDDDTSSQSSLADVDELLKGFTRSKALTSDLGGDVGSTPENAIRVDSSGVLKRPEQRKPTQAKIDRGKLFLKGRSTISRPVAKYSFSLDALVSQTQRDDADEIGIAKAMSLIEGSDSGRRGGETVGVETNANEAVLTSVVNESEDGGDIRKVLDAMKRVEAFDQDREWSFFENTLESRERLDDYDYDDYGFPELALESQGWQSSLRDLQTRTRAFLSGFIAEKAASGKVPDPILEWIIRRLPIEPREDLRSAYGTIIRSVPPGRLQGIVKEDLIDNLFAMLKAKPEALDVSMGIVPQVPASKEEARKDWSKLLAVVNLLVHLAEELNLSERAHALHLLLRLTVDARLMEDFRVSRATEDAISMIITRLPGDVAETFLHGISTTIHKCIPTPALRMLLLSHLQSCTPRISLFRCRLARSFFFNDPTLLSAPAEEVFSISRIKKDLRKLRLVLNENTDYAELAALAYMLDAAIDRGSSDSTPLDKAQEKVFNSYVDAVADKIKGMFTSMADTGASHLKRSEAKERFEALHYRLIYAVRTKPPPKTEIFGDSVANDLVRSSGFMHNFLAKRKEDKAEGDGVKKGQEDVTEGGEERRDTEETQSVP